jgi:lipopolysaccharide/colanic/teichoic acid biosynthesis glycosyltransferase
MLLAHPIPRWKRTMDIIGAGCGLLLASPVMALIAVGIKLTSPGPVMFKQRRCGLGGRPFEIFKFRTMCVDAEAKKQALRSISEQDGPAFKLKNDPRVTTIGKLLRKTSLDELPQFWNVLRGDMSLVGPRPLPVDEQNGCDQWQRNRLDVTPGLTCIWQIKGRSQVSFADWVRMDVHYLRRRTLMHDLKILLQTVPAVLLRRGAR